MARSIASFAELGVLHTATVEEGGERRVNVVDQLVDGVVVAGFRFGRMPAKWID